MTTDEAQRPRLDFRQVTDAATGRWDMILGALAANQIGDAIERPGRKMDCPFPGHGGKNDFRLFRNYADNGAGVCSCRKIRNGFELLQALNGWDIKTAMDQVAGVLWGEYDVAQQPARPAAPKHNHARNAKLKKSIDAVWSETIALSDPVALVATAYFNRRGIYWRSISDLDDCLRFHPALAFYERDDETDKITYQGDWPAIVAAIIDPDGHMVTLHRIYLDQASLYTGKAKAKKLMPFPDTRTLDGAAIRLGEADNDLGTTEGIETALAAREATGLSVWACYCDHVMGQFEPPSQVTRLFQFGDRDPKSRAGEKACMTGEQRLSRQMTVYSLIPGNPDDKCDWNDVLMSSGKSGFRNVQSLIDSKS